MLGGKKLWAIIAVAVLVAIVVVVMAAQGFGLTYMARKLCVQYETEDIITKGQIERQIVAESHERKIAAERELAAIKERLSEANRRNEHYQRLLETEDQTDALIPAITPDAYIDGAARALGVRPNDRGPEDD